MRKRRLSKVSINTKLIIDVALASLIVQKAPGLIDSIIAIPESLKAVAGAGAGYLVGSFMKKPDLANASIALGVVDFISPMVDGVLGTTSQTGTIPIVGSGASGGMMPPVINPDVEPGLSDYVRLNAYVSNPSNRQTYDDYYNSY